MEESPAMPRIGYAHASYTAANHWQVRARRRNQFAWGLGIGLFSLIIGIIFAQWAAYLFKSANLASIGFYSPILGALAAGVLLAIKAVRWLGIGLLTGSLIYILFYACLWAAIAYALN